jgi:hypothetical protein
MTKLINTRIGNAIVKLATIAMIVVLTGLFAVATDIGQADAAPRTVTVWYVSGITGCQVQGYSAACYTLTKYEGNGGAALLPVASYQASSLLTFRGQRPVNGKVIMNRFTQIGDWINGSFTSGGVVFNF